MIQKTQTQLFEETSNAILSCVDFPKEQLSELQKIQNKFEHIKAMNYQSRIKGLIIEITELHLKLNQDKPKEFESYLTSGAEYISLKVKKRSENGGELIYNKSINLSEKLGRSSEGILQDLKDMQRNMSYLVTSGKTMQVSKHKQENLQY